MRWLAAATLVAMLLAGCDTPPQDFSRERIVISIDDEGGGYAIGVPLWLAEDGATPEQWLERAVVHAGNATMSIRSTDAGPALWVEGTGSATINANDLLSINTGAGPEAYLNGEQSLGVGPNGRAILIVEAGDVDVTWQYEATSRDCSLFVNHGWTYADQPINIADYGGRPDARFDCTR